MLEAPLETERLILRPATLDDLDDLVTLESDPAVARFLRGGNPIGRDEVIERLERPGDRSWIVGLERETGRFVGNFLLTPSFELGWSLLPGCWGSGLATEGARSLLDLAFERMGAPRVWAVTMVVNTRSRRVMERCGMRFVRTFVANWHQEHPNWHEATEGAELGDVEYELARGDWEYRREMGGAR